MNIEQWIDQTVRLYVRSTPATRRVVPSGGGMDALVALGDKLALNFAEQHINAIQLQLDPSAGTAVATYDLLQLLALGFARYGVPEEFSKFVSANVE